VSQKNNVDVSVYLIQADIDQTAYKYIIIYHKAECTSLPEDEHLVVRNMSKRL